MTHKTQLPDRVEIATRWTLQDISIYIYMILKTIYPPLGQVSKELPNHLLLKVDVMQIDNINISASIYLFKVNNENTRKRCEICSKLTITTKRRR